MIEDWYTLDASPLEKKLDELTERVRSSELKLSNEYNDLKTLADTLSRRLDESERRNQELSTALTKVVEELRTQQTTQSLLLEEVRLLRTHEGVKHTNDLLEEIKVLKQRELNLLLREKIPIPFFSSTETLLTKKILL